MRSGGGSRGGAVVEDAYASGAVSTGAVAGTEVVGRECGRSHAEAVAPPPVQPAGHQGCLQARRWVRRRRPSTYAK
eukprot:5868610-Pleurochrysis_carterae.AAC.1